MAEIISGALRNEQEKRLVERAAEHVGENVSQFVREATLRRVVDVARSLPDPNANETTEEDRHGQH